jgi:hypothetical protein
MNQITAQEIEAQRLVSAYDSFIFSSVGCAPANFDDVACVMAFNAADACRAAARSYPVGSVDRAFWSQSAREMAVFVY